MTDRQRQMIAGYLPNPRDPELGPDEYYVEDMRGRAITVHIQSIAVDGYGKSVYQVRTGAGRLVHGPFESMPDVFGGGWYTMAHLYDNKTDCLDGSHIMFDEWEDLRRIQKEEES